MSIENKGPGGVGNSYGQRVPSKPTNIGKVGASKSIYNAALSKTSNAAFQSLIDKSDNQTGYAGAVICDWGSAGTLSTAGSTGIGALFALDSSKLLNGKPTVKATLQADAQTFVGSWTPTNPVGLQGVQTIQVPLFVTAISSSSINWVDAKLWLQTSDGKSVRLLLEGIPSGYQPGAWTTLSFSRGGATTTQDPLSSFDTPGVTLSKVQLVLTTTGNASANPLWFGEVRADVKSSVGRVVIRMDGEKITQYTKAFPVLKSLSLPVSLCLTGAEIGTNGFMDWSQIKEMHDTLRADCPLHTWDSTKQAGYANAANWPTAYSISLDRRQGHSALISNGITRGIGCGVWGYAETFLAGVTSARQQLVKDGLLGGGTSFMCKGLPYDGDIGSVLIPLVKVPVDPLVIHGACQVTNTTTLQQLISIVDAAEARGEAAIITFHHFVDDSATPGSLEIKIGIATEFFKYLANKSNEGKIVVNTLSELSSILASNGQFITY